MLEKRKKKKRRKTHKVNLKTFILSLKKLLLRILFALEIMKMGSFNAWKTLFAYLECSNSIGHSVALTPRLTHIHTSCTHTFTNDKISLEHSSFVVHFVHSFWCGSHCYLAIINLVLSILRSNFFFFFSLFLFPCPSLHICGYFLFIFSVVVYIVCLHSRWHYVSVDYVHCTI